MGKGLDIRADIKTRTTSSSMAHNSAKDSSYGGWSWGRARAEAIRPTILSPNLGAELAIVKIYRSLTKEQRRPEHVQRHNDEHIGGCATTVGRKRPWKLMEVTFTIDGQQAAELIQILNHELYL